MLAVLAALVVVPRDRFSVAEPLSWYAMERIESLLNSAPQNPRPDCVRSQLLLDSHLQFMTQTIAAHSPFRQHRQMSLLPTLA